MTGGQARTHARSQPLDRRGRPGRRGEEPREPGDLPRTSSPTPSWKGVAHVQRSIYASPTPFAAVLLVLALAPAPARGRRHGHLPGRRRRTRRSSREDDLAAVRHRARTNNDRPMTPIGGETRPHGRWTGTVWGRSSRPCILGRVPHFSGSDYWSDCVNNKIITGPCNTTRASESGRQRPRRLHAVGAGSRARTRSSRSGWNGPGRRSTRAPPSTAKATATTAERCAATADPPGQGHLVASTARRRDHRRRRQGDADLPAVGTFTV